LRIKSPVLTLEYDFTDFFARRHPLFIQKTPLVLVNMPILKKICKKINKIVDAVYRCAKL